MFSFDAIHLVGSKTRISGHNSQSFLFCGCDDEPIRRVAVVPGQLIRRHHNLNGEIRKHEVVRDQRAVEPFQGGEEEVPAPRARLSS